MIRGGQTCPAGIVYFPVQPNCMWLHLVDVVAEGEEGGGGEGGGNRMTRMSF